MAQFLKAIDVSVQFSSVAQSCPTICNLMNGSGCVQCQPQGWIHQKFLWLYSAWFLTIKPPSLIL